MKLSEIRQDLAILGNSTPDYELLHDIRKELIRKQGKDEIWNGFYLYQLGIIHGKRAERARKKSEPSAEAHSQSET
jgi:hypothetical protein